ncbi:MAG: RNA polymerase sigma factor [Gemmatimonadota bacterium]
MTEPTDESLIRALQQGDTRAAGELFDRYHDDLFAFASRLLGDRHAAEDAVQEAFLRVLRYARSFEGRSGFRSWVLRVTRNACLDLAHAARRRREGTERMPPAEPNPPPREPDSRIPRLRAALEQLPANRRQVLILRRFHDLSYAEIAELCGISEGAARVRAHRALRQLETALRPPAEDCPMSDSSGAA